jgi:hypothetical protein
MYRSRTLARFNKQHPQTTLKYLKMSFCSIIPPHIFQHVVRSDDVDTETKERHLHTLETSHRLRTLRVENAGAHAQIHHGLHQGPHQGVQGIVPPFIHSSIARSSSGEQRDAALATLAHDTDARSKRPTGLNRTIYDYHHSSSEAGLPGKTVLISEGGAAYPQSKDPSNDANECYAGFGDTYNFYKTVFNRNSIDANVGVLKAHIYAFVYSDVKYLF